MDEKAKLDVLMTQGSLMSMTVEDAEKCKAAAEEHFSKLPHDKLLKACVYLSVSFYDRNLTLLDYVQSAKLVDPKQFTPLKNLH
jgi:hypothetical protein